MRVPTAHQKLLFQNGKKVDIRRTVTAAKTKSVQTSAKCVAVRQTDACDISQVAVTFGTDKWLHLMATAGANVNRSDGEKQFK